ncbi:ras family domain-containing protein [Ditylenchus destructor]|nr:ras family domain-containing protein [Ditylenchus destructor]
MATKRLAPTTEDVGRPPKGPKTDTEDIIRLAIIGPEKSGKTTFKYQVSRQRVPYEEELASDPEQHYVWRHVQDRDVKVELVDSKDKGELQNIQGALMFYDSTNMASFGRIMQFWRTVQTDQKKIDYWARVPVALIANKCDAQVRSVPDEEAKKFADNVGWQFFVASALKNKNIDNLIDYILGRIVEDKQPKPQNPVFEDEYLSLWINNYRNHNTDPNAKAYAKILEDLMQFDPQKFEDEGKEIDEPEEDKQGTSQK